MTSGNNSQLYVAELKLPTCFYTITEQRHELPNPGGLEITKGYYIVRSLNENSVTKALPEIVLIIRFMNKTLKDAEDHAFKVGRLFSSLASAYGGYPFEEPYLHRIASISGDGRMKSQHNYQYGHKPYMLSNYEQTMDYQFHKYVESVSSVDADTRRQLQSAIHWYGMSISSDDPPVSYVAAWTGLESIGPVIDNIAHTDGGQSTCQTCGCKLGVKKNINKAKKDGIAHMFNRVASGPLSESLPEEAKTLLAKELVTGFSEKKARLLRNATVHGLGDIELLTKKCSEARRHLLHILNASIQSVLGPFVKSWITGDFEFHPIHRASIKCNELVNKSPYYGEWFNGPQYDSQSIVEEEERILSATFSLQWKLDTGLVELASKEGFRRDTDVFSPDGSLILDFPKWRERPLEPPWQSVSEFNAKGCGCQNLLDSN